MRAIHGGKMASHTHVIGCRAPVSHGVSRWRLLLYWIRRSLLLPLCLLASLSSCVLKEGLPSLLAALASLETPAAYRMSSTAEALVLVVLNSRSPGLPVCRCFVCAVSNLVLASFRQRDPPFISLLLIFPHLLQFCFIFLPPSPVLILDVHHRVAITFFFSYPLLQAPSDAAVSSFALVNFEGSPSTLRVNSSISLIIQPNLQTNCDVYTTTALQISLSRRRLEQLPRSWIPLS